MNMNHSLIDIVCFIYDFTLHLTWFNFVLKMKCEFEWANRRPMKLKTKTKNDEEKKPYSSKIVIGSVSGWTLLAWSDYRCIGLFAIIDEMFQILLYGIHWLIDFVLFWLCGRWWLWLSRKIWWNLIRYVIAHETLHEFTYQIPTIRCNHTRTILNLWRNKIW